MRVLIALAAAAALAVMAACGGDDGGGSSGYTREAEVGDITMKVTLLDPESGIALKPEIQVFPVDTLVIFSVVLDSRSTDVSPTNMSAASTLHQGESGVLPRGWMPDVKETNHVEGILMFPRFSADGPIRLVTKFGDEEQVEMDWDTQVPVATP